MAFLSPFWKPFLLSSFYFLLLQDPSTTKTNLATHALYLQLQAISGQHIAIGHQNAYLQGVRWTLPFQQTRPDFQLLTSKPPAIAGFDIGNFRDMDGIPYHTLADQMKRAHQDGAIITLSWHMHHPITGTKPGRDTHQPTDPVKTILPGGKKHRQYKRQLLAIAKLARKVIDQKGHPIPILFRPFHEHNGDWFWWSHTRPKYFVQLWRWTVSHLRNKLKIKHFLFVFSPSAQYHKRHQTNYLYAYPGDKYVDIFGLDCYQNSLQTCLPRIREVVSLAQRHHKIAALTEHGPLHAKELQRTPPYWTKRLLQPLLSSPLARHLSYVMFWRNATREHRYLPIPASGILPASSSAKDFQSMLRHPSLWTANERHPTSLSIWTLLYASHLQQQTPLQRQRAAQPLSLWARGPRRVWDIRFHATHTSLHRSPLQAKNQTHKQAIALVWPGVPRQTLSLQLTSERTLQLYKRKLPEQTHTAITLALSFRAKALVAAFCWLGNETLQILLLDHTNQLQLLSHPLHASKTTTTTALSSMLKKPLYATNRAIGWDQTETQTQHLLVQHKNGHLFHFEQHANTSKWKVSQPTSRSPRRTLPASQLAMTFSTLDQRRHLFFRGRDNHIYELRSPSTGKPQPSNPLHKQWLHFDLHRETTQTTPAKGHPSAIFLPTSQQEMLVWNDPTGQIHVLQKQRHQQTWRHSQLQNLVGGSIPPAVESSVLVHWPEHQSIHIMIPTSTKGIIECWREGQTWRQNGLNQAVGLSRDVYRNLMTYR